MDQYVSLASSSPICAMSPCGRSRVQIVDLCMFFMNHSDQYLYTTISTIILDGLVIRVAMFTYHFHRLVSF